MMVDFYSELIAFVKERKPSQKALAAEKARLEEMCKKLLANTVIEDYRIEL